MYNSPIEIVAPGFTTQIKEALDSKIFEAVQNIGVKVDINELKKALNYDRKSYDRGFEDGVIYLSSILKRLYCSDQKILITLNRLDTIIEDIIEGD